MTARGILSLGVAALLATSAALKLSEVRSVAVTNGIAAGDVLSALFAIGEVCLVILVLSKRWRQTAFLMIVGLFLGAATFTTASILAGDGSSQCNCFGRIRMTRSVSLIAQGALILMATLALELRPRFVSNLDETHL